MVRKQPNQLITGERRTFSAAWVSLLIGSAVLAIAPAALGDTDCVESAAFAIDNRGCDFDGDCDDTVVCTDDSCDPATGSCGNIANHANCPDDGVFCNGVEFCDPIMGCLSSGDPCDPLACDEENDCCSQCDEDDDCSYLSDECNTGVCNGACGICVRAPSPNGTACDNGDACSGDTCQAGTCMDICTDGVACTIDSCDGGQCSHVPDDTACDDGNVCTDDTCDPGTGCTNVNNTGPCSDGSECTSGDQCADGRCTPTGFVDCDDGLDCTRDRCDPATGLCDDSVPDDALCDDHAFCNGVETCNGETGECPSGTNPCAVGEVCDEANDLCVPPCTDDVECVDSEFCNGVEFCWAAGFCAPGSYPCGDWECDDITASCVECTSDAPCDDGVACNGVETCDLVAGICQPGTAVDCNNTEFCDGSEQCDPDTGDCGDGPDPCDPAICDETNDRCNVPCTSEDPRDFDGDGVVDDCDFCPKDWNPDQSDVDRDAVGDACDNCMYVPNGPASGTCVQGRFHEPCADDRDCDTGAVMNGVCSLDQEDSDGDGVGDACDTDDDNDGWPDEGDNCPLHPNPGVLCLDPLGCSCDAAQWQLYQVDSDCDGVGDVCDNCVGEDNPDQDDADGDGAGDICDNCPAMPNGPHLGTCVDGRSGTCMWSSQCNTRPGDGVCTRGQEDTDGDCPLTLTGEECGDACDPDIDGDGILNGDDNCPVTFNPEVVSIGPPPVCAPPLGTLWQQDSDCDGIGEVCDRCLGSDDATDYDCDGIPNGDDNCPSTSNPSQLDTDGDCPPTLAGKECGDACDRCPGFDNSLDADGDGRPDACDNCPGTYNPSQPQRDLDGDCPTPLAGANCGDACDPDIDGDGILNGDDNCPVTFNPEVVSIGPPPVCAPPLGTLWQQDSDCDCPNPLAGVECGDACDGCTDPIGSDYDGDGIPDICDNCPDHPNPDQANLDNDPFGDVCDPDDDNDGWPDAADNCRVTPNGPDIGTCIEGTIGESCAVPSNCDTTPGSGDGSCDLTQADTDEDGVGNVCDNCPDVHNPDQRNSDGDEEGDACDECPNDPSQVNYGHCGCSDDPALCGDGNICTVDSCVEGIGCIHVGTGVTVNCDDGDACTTDDVCQGDAAGTCAGTVASTPEAERLSETGPVNAKNRFVSIKTTEAGRNQAIRVRFVDLPSPFDVWNGMDFFAGTPREVCENSGQGLDLPAADCSIVAGPTRTFWVAPLVCVKEPAHLMDWRGRCDAGTCVGGLNEAESCLLDEDCVEIVHLYHEGLIPGGIYDVQVANSSCLLEDDSSYSAPLTMIQSVWGDVCGPSGLGACTAVSDGTVDVTNDVLGVLDKFANINDLQKARADLEPGDDGTNNGPDFLVNVANDVLYCLDAFTGAPYPFVPGDPCNPG